MSKNRENIKRIIILICALCFFIFLYIKIHKSFKGINESFSEDLPSTYLIPQDDSTLIGEKYLHDLKINKVIRSKNREPISLIFFKKEYHLFIYRIHLARGTSLRDLLHTNIESVDRTTGEVYTVITHNNFVQFEYRAAPVKPITQIYLTIAGDSLKTVAKNDSIISYHLICDNLSLRYKDKDPVDILVSGNDVGFGRTNNIPMDLLFLKRDTSVYLLLMTPNNRNSVIAPNLLYNVVMGI